MRPQLSIDSEPSFENDFIFTVKFEVIPIFEIEDLSNMSIEDFEVKIDENDIDEVIKNIQKQHIKWEKTKEKAFSLVFSHFICCFCIFFITSSISFSSILTSKSSIDIFDKSSISNIGITSNLTVKMKSFSNEGSESIDN